MRLGSVLKIWRRSERIGIRDAARILHVSSATLSRIERGKAIDGKTLVKLLDWLLHNGEQP